MRLVDIALSGGAMRTAMLFVILVVMIAWAALSAWTVTLQEIPAGVVTLISMLIAGKASEKFITKESKK